MLILKQQQFKAENNKTTYFMHEV